MSDSGRTLSRPEDDLNVYRVRYLGPANNKTEGVDLVVQGSLTELRRLFPMHGVNGGWVLERIRVASIAEVKDWAERMGLCKT